MGSDTRAGVARRSSSSSSRKRAPVSSGSRGAFPRMEIIPPAILLIAALLFGGSANPVSDMLIELLATALLALLAIRFTPADWRRTRLGWCVALLALAIAAIELVPLPYAIWRGLPGRAPFAATLDLLGLGGGARPISLDPNATTAALIQIIPGIAAFVAALAAGSLARRTWTTAIIAGAGACVLLGSLQIIGQSQFYLYSQSHFGNVTGLFANRNHCADLLLIGIALLAARLKATRSGMLGSRITFAGLMLAMAVTVVLTASRFGMTLLAIEALAIAIALRGMAGRYALPLIIVVTVIGAAGAGLLTYSASVNHAVSRFRELPDDLRPEIWGRTLYAAGQYWPAGSGLGTFVPIYDTVERLDKVTTQIINHAHNEYLELLLELGIVGVLLIVGYFVGLVTVIARRARQGAGPEFLAATAGILVLLAHSIVEFPLRNESLMVTFGLLNGIVFASRTRRDASAR